MNNAHSILMVVVISLVTILLRFLPFLIFGKRKTPEYISYFGRVLPYSIMGMLVVYCMRNVSILTVPYGIPELIACVIVIFTHIWKRNTLLSILIGTLVYMFMVQFLF